MFIPLALGTLVALLIAPRRLFWHLLAAAFVSSAVAVVAQQWYWLFAPAWIFAVALRTMVAERPAVTEAFTTTLAGILVWASDNTIISQALVAFAAALAQVVLGIFKAVGEAIGLAGALGGAVGAALAWTYLARRIERAAEEVPFVVIAAVMLGWVLINAVINAVGQAAGEFSELTALSFQALAVVVAFVSIYRIYEALKGQHEAAVDAAIGAPFVAAAFPELWATLIPIMAVFVILDTAISAFSRRLGASALALAFAMAYVGRS
jgi:heme/copper-type cytochrome/quinol oxidase subunit 2